jgi:hypothetical protein
MTQADQSLNGVACLSATECWAVYLGVDSYILEFTDGAWSTVPIADPSDVSLKGVACSSGTCWAVGLAGSDDTVIETNSGGGWQTVAAPAPSDDVLMSVACVDATDCWADGYVLPGNPAGSGGVSTLIEQHDGGGWAVASSPDPTSAWGDEFSSITCVSVSACWAVGTQDDGPGSGETLIVQGS